MKRAFRFPPFEVNRMLRTGLAVQLADALRTAIHTGYYGPGDILPPIRDLSEITGMSSVLVSRAIRILKDERLVSPRPHIGCVVCAPDSPMWKGQVLIVVPPGGAIHYLNVVVGELRDALTSAGYLVLAATAQRKADGAYDFSLLETMLRQRVELVVQLHDRPEITRYLARFKVPFLRFSRSGGRTPSGCIGTVLRRMDAAVPDFVEHCRERKVRNVIQVSVSRYGVDACRALKEAGFKVRAWRIGGRSWTSPTGPALSRRVAAAVSRRMASEGRAWLPEVLFINDDYVAAGVLTALLSANVRIPEDVGVVTWENRDCGCGPAFVKPFTRMEVVAAEDGRRLAAAVLACLRGEPFPPVEVVPAYIRGETF